MTRKQILQEAIATVFIFAWLLFCSSSYMIELADYIGRIGH